MPASTGNVQSLTGVPGTFAEGLNPGYLYREPPDEYVDEFGAGTGTLLMKDQAGKGRVVFNEASGYRTMVSGVIAGQCRVRPAASCWQNTSASCCTAAD